MTSFTGANGTQLSAAMLTDPNALKKHLSNGTPISSHFETPSLSARRSSEPLHSESYLEMSSVPDIASQQSKDDAYHVLENKGKKPMSFQNATIRGQMASSTFDPRHLLDPKGFSIDQRQRDHESASTESDSYQPSSSNQQPNGKSSSGNGKTSQIDVKSSHKRDREDREGQGMSSLIEKVHNVSQREERPQKKSRIENDEFDAEEDGKAKFVGGSKGGEIGDHLKEKKKQGVAESGPVNAIVDLTGGTYHFFKHSSLIH